MEVDTHSRVASSIHSKDKQVAEDTVTLATSSGIKEGTDYGDSNIRTRRGYHWETLMGDSPVAPCFSRGIHVLRDHRWHFWHEEKKKSKEYWVSWRGKLAQWFGLSPIAYVYWDTGGLSADVILEKSGRRTRYAQMRV
jgi:hypothetical protein